MRERTLDEEIPDTTEALIIYRKGIIRELDKIEPAFKRLKLALEKANRKLEYNTKGIQ